MDISELPVELTCPTLQLIALLGLDVHNNAAHKSIWDALMMNRRPDRRPLNFQLASGSQHFLDLKAKEHLEDSADTGILKTTWMQKHLQQVPAVLVLFVDLDWNHPSWTEKVAECASKIKSIRQNSRGRNPYLALVLLQPVATLPTDEAATQKAAELCSACELSSKLLFILPQSDRLFGYILRLEHAFFEIAQNYYQNELKMAKTKKDALSRSVSQRLYVRYSFKQGFFSELCQDPLGALRYYKQAYQMLLEIEPAEHAVTELKVIGGFLTYKICNLCFKHNKPIDSLSHFRRHIDYFKGKTGTYEVEFEHFAWLARQFWVFADLFEAAVQKGLVTGQTQHPGFYYQTAAEYMIQRKELGRTTVSLASDGQTDGTWPPVKYYGQRLPGEADHASMAVYKAALRKYLYRHEASVNYSSIILLLLSNALSQFKKHSSARMKLVVMVRIAEQYFYQEEFELSLQVLSHALSNFRKGRWWPLMKACVALGLRCAFATADMKAYVRFSLEALHPLMNFTVEERHRIYSNLLRIVSSALPELESMLSHSAARKAVNSWQSQLEDKSFMLIPMDDLLGCISVDCCFSASEVFVGTEVLFRIDAVLLAPEKMHVFKIAVKFNNQAYSSSFAIDQCGVFLEPGVVRTFCHKICPPAEHVDTELKPIAISIDLGGVDSKVYVSLLWENFTQENRIHSASINCGRYVNVPVARSLRILPAPLKVDLEYDDNATTFVDEVRSFAVGIRSREDFALPHLRLTAKPERVADSTVCTFGVSAGAVSLSEVSVNTSVGPKSRSEATLFLCFQQAQDADFAVHLELSYMGNPGADDAKKNVYLLKTGTIFFKPRSVFAVNSSVLSLLGDKLSCLVLQEESLLRIRIENVANTPITVQKAVLQLSEVISLQEPDDETCFSDVTLREGDEYVGLAPIVPRFASAEAVGLGCVLLFWRRTCDPVGKQFTTKLPLLRLPVEACPVLLHCCTPAFGILGQPFPLVFSLVNTTANEIRASISVEVSERFTFYSGIQKDIVIIAPAKTETVTLNVLPLLTGSIPLPRLRISLLNAEPENFTQLCQRNVTSAILVLPNSCDTSDKQENFA
uniref:Foie-gras_1 domain-containing protein n=1 Tax=Trichuris muris TaxID=70415 RepID=A0A5S6QQT5_TRIMR